MKFSLRLLIVSSLVALACQNPCEDIYCLNGGECEKGKCICPEFTSGETCQFREDCFDVNCQNGGFCEADTCNCPVGFIGNRCQTPDPCLNVTCEVWEECIDGNCECPIGYEGLQCDTMERQKFLGGHVLSGVISCPSTGTFNISAFNMSISPASSPQNVLIQMESDMEFIGSVDGNAIYITNAVSAGYMYNGGISFDGSAFILGITREDSEGEVCNFNLTTG